MLRGSLHAHASSVTFLQRLLDAFAIFLVYGAMQETAELPWDALRILAVALGVMLFALLAEVQGVYRSWRTSSLAEEIRVIVSIWSFVVFALLVLAFATKTSAAFSRIMMVSWFVIVPVALVVVRILVKGALRRARIRGANIRTVAIVGDNGLGRRVIKHLESMPWAGLVVKGVFDSTSGGGTSCQVGQASYPLGAIDDLLAMVHEGGIDSVYLALPLHQEGRIQELISRLADTTASVYVVPDMFVSDLMLSRWVDFGGMPLVSIHETPFDGVYGWVKRLEDIALSCVILLLTLPVMAVIALAVKASSPGPILFRQRRYGLNGTVVEVWKFRTMRICEDGNEVRQAARCDARVTPLGSILRRTSLDELPQFFNVLFGSMSVVGPRPHAVIHNEQYRKLIHGYMLRHKVKPGITGWAQINGWRGETDTLDKMQKRVEYDLEYIQNWSIWLDLKIVFLTLLRGFGGKNAY
ncbi:MAG TPA: undecaprenyl-phosphate glucose phosphotransferase [Rhodocyclaceae bacterium]|nr:undecaprenyl-phosphate glucose phosphotransferase [Rhodocyclaceae bacterium]